MQLMEVIHKRRATRLYRDQAVSENTVRLLLDAAIHAPSAVNQQPWAFVVIQDKKLMKDLSDRSKTLLLKLLVPGTPLYEHRGMLEDPEFNVFYNSGTLILICANHQDSGAAEDCCLAAENLMLAAVDLGLSTCPIGFARPLLNEPAVKQDLNIPGEYVVVFPVIVGYSASEMPEVSRRAPEILAWKQ